MRAAWAILLLVSPASAATLAILDAPSEPLPPGGDSSPIVMTITMSCLEQVARSLQTPGTVHAGGTIAVTTQEPTLFLAGSQELLFSPCEPDQTEVAVETTWTVSASVETLANVDYPLAVQVDLDASPSPLDENTLTDALSVEAEPVLALFAKIPGGVIVLEDPTIITVPIQIETYGNVASTVRLLGGDLDGADQDRVGTMEPASFDPGISGIVERQITVDLSDRGGTWESTLTLTFEATGDGAAVTDHAEVIVRRGTNLGERFDREVTPGPAPALAVMLALWTVAARRRS